MPTFLFDKKLEYAVVVQCATMFFLSSGTLLCCATAAALAHGYTITTPSSVISLLAASSLSSLPVKMTIPSSLSSLQTLAAQTLPSSPISSTGLSVWSSVNSTRHRMTLTAVVTRTVVTTVRPLTTEVFATKAQSTLTTTVAGDLFTLRQSIETQVQLTATVTVLHLQYLTVHQTLVSVDKSARTTTLSAQEDVFKAFGQISLATASPVMADSSRQRLTIAFRTTVTIAQSSPSSTVLPVSSILALPQLRFSPGGVLIFSSGTTTTFHIPFILIIVSCIFAL